MKTIVCLLVVSVLGLAQNSTVDPSNNSGSIKKDSQIVFQPETIVELLKDLGHCGATQTSVEFGECSKAHSVSVSVSVNPSKDNENYGELTISIHFLHLPTISFVLQSTVSPINNSKGYELRSYGIPSTGTERKLFSLQVFDSSTGDFSLIYGNKRFGVGTLK